MAEDDKPKPFFDDEKKKKVVEWINEKLPEFKCECCGTQQWIISEDIVVPINFTGGLNFGGNAYPHVMLMCKNCGNTKFLNAVVMGILRSTAEVLADEKKAGEDGK